MFGGLPIHLRTTGIAQEKAPKVSSTQLRPAVYWFLKRESSSSTLGERPASSTSGNHGSAWLR
jgi:spore germination protein GerM